MAQYTAQKTVTDQTLISLSQLDTKYQQVALSALNLSEAERQEINTKLQGLATGSLMTGQQMQELLMDTNLDAATKKRILSETGLTNAIGVNTIAEKAHVLSQLEVLLNNKAITKAEYDAIVAKMADVGATNTMTGANMGLAASFKTLMASIPVWGWIALAISAVISVLQKIIPMLKSTSERFEENKQALADISSEIESVNDELATTLDRINELKSKGKLSFTEASELKRLQAENIEREHSLELLDKELLKKKELAINFFKTSTAAGKAGSVSPDWDGQFSDIGDTEDGSTSTSELKTFFAGFADDFSTIYIPDLSDIQEYQMALQSLYDAGYEYGADKTVDLHIDNINRILDAYSVYIGATDKLFAAIYNRAKFSEARTEIEKLAEAGNLTAESLQNLYNQGGNVKEFIDYMLSLNTVDWKTMLGDKFTDVAEEDGIVSLDEALTAMAGDTEIASKIMGLFANELNKVEEAAESATSNIQTFSDVFKSIKEGTDVLADAYSDIEDGGEISLEHLMSLLDKYPDLVEYVNLENGQHNITIGILKAKFEAEKKAQLAKITASKSTVNAEIAEQKAILDTIATKKEKAKQDMAEAMVSIGQFKTVGDALNAINARPGYYLRGFDWDVGDAKVALADAEKQLKNLSAQEVLIKNMSWEDITSGSGSKTEKTEAEKYFDKQKYLLETNQITQEEYLKRINQKYQHFYNKTAEYLEDYAKYSQEVYDGFKDMYKEDLEAQKEAWEEKKDAVSEYYDNLREQIENAHDKEDYEKEQSEKRKEIFDLDMQIAELMRDGSEKAKARIAELEEERLKAEEELLDFETDKAREDELSRLEKEQEAEEAKIQNQIDAIDEELQKIDGDIVDGLYNVRKTIVDYAAKKGITLDFAYASGTRSSVGGLGRINEKGIEMISAPDGNGNYIPMLPNSYVFSAKATEFLWKLATEHSLPQAMYNSIAKSIRTQSTTPSVNIAQPITITMGDVIIKGNADKQTVADIKKEQENTVRMVLQKIKELQK